MPRSRVTLLLASILLVATDVIGVTARVDGFRLLQYSSIALLCFLRAILLQQGVGVGPKGVDCRDDLLQAFGGPFPAQEWIKEEEEEEMSVFVTPSV